MKNLIDRDVAYSVLEEYYHICTETQRMSLREALSRVPDGIVRCGECKHQTICLSEVSSLNETLTQILYTKIEFCSRGERKE